MFVFKSILGRTRNVPLKLFGYRFPYTMAQDKISAVTVTCLTSRCEVRDKSPLRKEKEDLIADMGWYHDPCADGTYAAHQLQERKMVTTLNPYKHGETDLTKVNVENKKLLFVDLCPKLDVLTLLSKSAKSIMVVDHHETSIVTRDECKLSNVKIDLDTSGKVCGAMMVWHYLNGDKKAPDWLRVVNECDTKPIVDRDPDDQFMHDALTETDLIKNIEKSRESLIKRGKEMALADKRVSQHLEKIQFRDVIISEKKYRVAFFDNVDWTLVNRLGDVPDVDFVVCCTSRCEESQTTKEKTFFSLRRPKTSNVNLATIASAYGGGGHAGAAGIQILGRHDFLPDSN